MRLIDVDALLRALSDPHGLMMFDGSVAEETGEWGFMMRRSDVIGTVMSAPTVDAVPVVHARWDYSPPKTKTTLDGRSALVRGSEKIMCSACKNKAKSPDWLKFSFCPNCGAKMDGGCSDG